MRLAGASTLWKAGIGLGVAATTAPSLHVGALTVGSLRLHECGTDTSTRFVVVVPAHEEEVGIEATILSLGRLDYPADRHEVVILADNCTDSTATIARRLGVTVMERFDDDNRGKGQALSWAIPQILSDPAIDAIVIVDADSLVDEAFLQHASWHIRNGAAAIQADYRVRNPHMSWRTRMLDVAFTAQHRTRGAGRSALGLSSGLNGNGMVFTRDTLEEVPYTAFSIIEDIEYGMMLGCSGRRVVACPGTFVAGDMPASSKDAAAQRARWEAGTSVVRRHHLKLLADRTLRHRDPVTAGLAADLVAPPLANATVMLAATSVLSLFRIRRWSVALILLGWASISGHVALAVSRSEDPVRSLTALRHVPTYVVWKLRLRFTDHWNELRSGSGAWERSARSSDVEHQEEPLAEDTTTGHDRSDAQRLESQGVRP